VRRSVCCKKLKSLCITPRIHIIATEEGIEKNGMGDPKFDEIETLIAAVRRKYGNNPVEGMNIRKRSRHKVKK